MCLVLGCPGAGCTTFLRTIANQREGYSNVSGEVTYAGITAEEMQKYYKGEVVYNQEGESPSITPYHSASNSPLRRYSHRDTDCGADFEVRPFHVCSISTLCLSTLPSLRVTRKTPGPNGRLPGISRREFDREVEDLLLRMLNIPHTKNTLVGDEFVRGVSGGERKRVSIAEMMATRARVQCWDNSTRGLDASTALDFVRSLRVMTDILGQTTFVSLCVHVILPITMSSNFPVPGIKLARASTSCLTKYSC